MRSLIMNLQTYCYVLKINSNKKKLNANYFLTLTAIKQEQANLLYVYNKYVTNIGIKFKLVSYIQVYIIFLTNLLI